MRSPNPNAILVWAMVVVCVVAPSSFASLIEADSPLGSSTAFIDTNTGMQWLDLSVTFGRSFDDVSAELGEGGLYHGFRYASLDEVRVLLAGLGLEFTTGENKSHAQYQLLENFLRMMAVPSGTRCCDVATIRPAYGLTSTLAESPNPGDSTEFYWASFLQTTADGYTGSPPNVFYDAAWVEPQATRLQSDIVPVPSIGSWLTRQVPEPATLTLLALGLAGLGFSRRKH